MSEIILTDEQLAQVGKIISEKTTMKAYSIKLDDSRTPSIFDSKVGGTPYFPDDMDVPMSTSDKPLQLLAQLNMADFPNMNRLPKTGMLQFFIENEECFGLDFDEPDSNKDFRVIFHKEIDTNVSEEKIRERFGIDDIEEFLLPQEDRVILLKAEETTVSLSPTDYRFDELWKNALIQIGIPEADANELNWWDYEELQEIPSLDSTGHRLFGYPYFTQTDPRTENCFSDYELLFQLDTDQLESSEYDDIIWGDCGVGNFFIKEEDLRNLDFSRVMYNWDCC